MSAAQSLRALIDAGADDAPALTAPGSRALTYRELRRQVDTTVGALNALGIGRGDKVAIVLPNGPCMASAFLSVAAAAASAPLNPAYRADEFEFYLN
ncbi:MAG: AMP-binding protein, partial [Betaproteobacteria bacterium]